MHRAVPPFDVITSKARKQQATPPAPPRNITKQHWEKFQALKARRRELCHSGHVKRVLQAKKKLLDTVSKELSNSDKDLLKEDGVKLPRSAERASKKRASKKRACYKTLDTDTSSSSSPSHQDVYSPSHQDVSSPSHQDVSSPLHQDDRAAGYSGLTEEPKWQELKNYLDPNPQLKGWDKRRLLPKSELEKILDKMVERGDLDKAASISDKIANRELACKVATAFDCVEYTKRCKMEEERKRKKTPAKLKWMFEQKHLWESKGNM